MEQVFIAWTIENWITVILMAAAGYLLFTLLVQLLKKNGNLGSSMQSQTLNPLG